MTLSFDPKTAYAHTWRYQPGIETALLKFREPDGTFKSPVYVCKAVRADLSTTDWQNYGQMLLTNETIVWCVWSAGSNAPTPSIDSVLVVDGAAWVVTSVMDGRWGPEWVCGCVRMEENANG